MALVIAWNDARRGFILADTAEFGSDMPVSSAIISTASSVIVGLCGQLDARIEAEGECRNSMENIRQVANRLSECVKRAHQDSPAPEVWPFGAIVMGTDSGCVRQATITGGMISWSALGGRGFGWLVPGADCNSMIRSEGAVLKDLPAEEIPARLRGLANRLATEFPEEVGGKITEASLLAH